MRTVCFYFKSIRVPGRSNEAVLVVAIKTDERQAPTAYLLGRIRSGMRIRAYIDDYIPGR
jgi:hypothetical protein